ncbi:MAG: hypothetical protein HY907_11250 [Deltaproteobacteria bacterium]|nr:hypothetical protein [Deltaproteobacteria bacterium]
MRRSLAVAAGIAAGIAAAAALGGFEADPAPPRPRIVPDSGGAIRELLVHWVPAHADLVLPTYRDLRAALDDDVVVRVAVDRAEDFDDFVRRVGEGGVPPRLEPVVVGRPITIWSRDRFATAELSGRPLLVVPERKITGVVERANDWIVPWVVAAAGRGPSVLAAPFVFDGGDLVADERFVYATAVLRGRNEGTRWGEADTLREALAARFDREVLLLGGDRGEVPDHHICMIATPVGGGVVLVGDVGLGREVWEGAEGRGGGETGFTAEALRTLRGTLRKPREGAPRLPEGMVADFSDGTAARFRRVAEELRKAGLRVVPVPLVATTTPYAYISYNNVLIDDREDGRHVLVPQFGVEALDAAGREVWEREGFIVHPIDVSKLWVHGGALRCVAAVVRRSTAARTASR